MRYVASVKVELDKPVDELLTDAFLVGHTCKAISLRPLVLDCSPISSKAYHILIAPRTKVVGGYIRSFATARRILPEVWPWPLPLPRIVRGMLCVAGVCGDANAYYVDAHGVLYLLDMWLSEVQATVINETARYLRETAKHV